MEYHKLEAVQDKSLDKQIRWFRCVVDVDYLTAGKLYPATTVDSEGDLAVVDDDGYPCWVVITESHKKKRHRNRGRMNICFKEVIPDED